MKTVSYGNEIDNAEIATSNLELLVSDDKISANSINRTIQNIYEDEEYSYILLQNIVKNIYGRENGVLPNILEEFKNVRLLESGTGKQYLRIPFGAINLSQPHHKDNGMSHGLSYSGEEGTDEKKIVNTEFLDDGFDTYTIINKPRLGIAKRQIADFINLDIADLDNNIKIYAKKFDNKEQLGKSYVYKMVASEQGKAELETYGINGGTNADGTENSSNVLDNLTFPFVGYNVSITENTIGAVNSDIYAANTETSYFPNNAEDTSWVILFKRLMQPGSGSTEEESKNYPISFSFREKGKNKDEDKTSDYLPTIDTYIDIRNSSTIENQINSIVSDINTSYKDYYYAEKIEDTFTYLSNGISYSENHPAVKIVSKINYTDLTNNVLLSIDNKETSYIDSNTQDGYYTSSGREEFPTKTVKALAQDYYYDSVSLLTGIFSKYSSYVVNQELSKKEFALEELIELPELEESYAIGDIYKCFVYLNSDLDNKIDDGSSRENKDISISKLFGCVQARKISENSEERFENFNETKVYTDTISKTLRSKPIALFSLNIEYINGFPKITDQELLFPILDPSKINTRAAGLNNLFVDTNTKIQNQFYYSDEGVVEWTPDAGSISNDENNSPTAWNPIPVEEKRAIKSCVSTDRDQFSEIDDDVANKAVDIGIDDAIETFAPYIYNHSQDGNTQEVIGNDYGKRIKLLGRKLRIEQQQTSGNYNDLNLLELKAEGLLFKRNETTKIKNYIELRDNTSEMKTRDTGLELFADKYIGDDDVSNYFKLYSNNNKTWIKGITGRITLAANKSESNEADVTLENETTNYFDFEAIYNGSDNRDKEQTNKGTKYLKLLGNFIVGDSNTKFANDVSYVSVLNTDTFIKGKFNVSALNDIENVNDCSSLTIEKDKVYASNYNDFWLSGNLKGEIADTGTGADNKGRYSLRIRNNEGLEFRKIVNNNTDNNEKNNEENNEENSTSKLFLNDDNVLAEFKNNYLKLYEQRFDVDVGSKTNVNSHTKLEMNYVTVDNNGASTDVGKFKVSINKLDANTEDYISLDSTGKFNVRTSNKVIEDTPNVKINTNLIEIGAYEEDINILNSSSSFRSGDVKVKGKVNIGVNNSENGNLSVYGKTILGYYIDDETQHKIISYYGKEYEVTSDDGGIVTLTNIDSSAPNNEKFLDYRLYVEGNTSLHNDVSVRDKTEFFGNLSVTGDTIINGGLTVNSDVEINNLESLKKIVDGNEVETTTVINGDLTVNGATNFNYKLNDDDTVDTSGTTTVRKNVTLTNFVSNATVTAEENLKINGVSTFNSENGNEVNGSTVNATTTVTNNVTIETLIANDVTEVKSKLTLKGNTTFNSTSGATTVKGDATLNNNLIANGQVEVDSGAILYLKRNATFNSTSGTTTVKGNATLGSLSANITKVENTNGDASLTIARDATFNSESGTTTVKGDATITTLKVEGSSAVTTVTGSLNIGPNASSATTNKTTVSGGAITIIGSSATTDATTISGGAITTTSVQTNSSKTKKKNIVHSERNAVKAINDIEIVDFFYKSDVKEENQKVGFIAEDVDSIFSTNKKDCMDHSNCIGMLLKAVQELSKEIEELKKHA